MRPGWREDRRSQWRSGEWTILWEYPAKSLFLRYKPPTNMITGVIHPSRYILWVFGAEGNLVRFGNEVCNHEEVMEWAESMIPKLAAMNV